MKAQAIVAERKNGKFVPAFFALLALLSILSLISLSTGSSNIGFKELLSFLSGNCSGNQQASLIITQLRLPRLVLAMLTGASLAIAGAGMQGIFRNPLADPSITGVSSGAALGAVLAITLGLPFWGMQIGALACGLSAFAAVCILGRLEGRLNALSMLLAGIAVNAFCGALVGYCMYNAREGGLKSFVFWSLGSLDAADWNGIILCACFAIPAWIILLLSHRGLDLMSLGAEQAFNSGLNVKRLWYATAFAASAATAACVAISGVIGFVGLVVPHMMRMLCGAENKKSLPLSAIAGANLLVASDLISRLLSPSDAVPIGVITALTGVPFFMFLLARNKRRENA